MAYESGLRTKFRQALKIALAAHFTAATEADDLTITIPFEDGQLDGPQERNIGCVWFDSVRPHRNDWNNWINRIDRHRTRQNRRHVTCALCVYRA